MAHELAYRADKSAAMAFTGETPWHGLGQRLTEAATIEQWTQEAGLTWQALSAVPRFTRADGSVGSFDDKQVIYRSDTGAPLSVMGNGYKIVQPGEVLEFFRNLVKDHGFKLSTAGALQGGRKIWALAKNGHAGEVVKGDKLRQFLLMATSLDGTTPTVAAFISTRVVCANTMRTAMGEVGRKARAGRVVTSHRSEFDAADVRAQLGFADDTWNKYMQAMRTLAERPCMMEEARELLRRVFGNPVKTKRGAVEVVEAAPAADAGAKGHDSLQSLLGGNARAIDTAADALQAHEARGEVARLIAQGSEREQKSVARCLELFAGAGRGADHPGVKGTRWGLLNAVTEHIDHEQGRTADNRLNSAWFGRGEGFKQSALAELIA